MRWRGVIAVIVVLGGALACRAVFRAPAEPVDPAVSRETRLLAGMNPYLLTNLVSDRLAVEVDWVAGGAPDARAIVGLEQALRRHAAPGKRIEIRLDEEIPVEEWRRRAVLRLDGMVRRYLDPPPIDAPRGERLYVLYLPSSDVWYEPGLFGYMVDVEVPAATGTVSVPVIQIFFEQVRAGAKLWITPRKVERAILVHELGHVLGLVSDPGHLQRGGEGHCTEPQCVMHRPGTASNLYNAPRALFAGSVPDGYCKRCRADIEWARRRFGELAGQAERAF